MRFASGASSFSLECFPARLGHKAAPLTAPQFQMVPTYCVGMATDALTSPVLKPTRRTVGVKGKPPTAQPGSECCLPLQARPTKP